MGALTCAGMRPCCLVVFALTCLALILACSLVPLLACFFRCSTCACACFFGAFFTKRLDFGVAKRCFCATLSLAATSPRYIFVAHRHAHRQMTCCARCSIDQKPFPFFRSRALLLDGKSFLRSVGRCGEVVRPYAAYLAARASCLFRLL